MLNETNVAERASEYAPLIAKFQDTLFKVLDTETKRMKGLRKTLFGIARECRSSETFVAVLKGEEQAWRKARSVGDGDKVTMPQIPGSYRTTKSAIIKAIEDGPSMVLAIRKNCAQAAVETGESPAELMNTAFGGDGEGFLVFTSDRYAGENGDSVFFADHDKGKVHRSALSRREERNRTAQEKAAKVAANGLASGGEEVPVLSDAVGAALNRFIQVVHGTHGVIADDDVVAYLDDAGKGLAEWIAEHKAGETAEVADKVA